MSAETCPGPRCGACRLAFLVWLLLVVGAVFAVGCDSGVRRQTATDGTPFTTFDSGVGQFFCTRQDVQGVDCVVCLGPERGAMSCRFPERTAHAD